jgi:hypothetical protein
MCDGTSRSGCASTLSQYNSARDVEIAGLVVGGAAAVASGVLFYMVYGREPSHNVTPVGVSLPVCGFAGTSVGCVGRF